VGFFRFFLGKHQCPSCCVRQIGIRGSLATTLHRGENYKYPFLLFPFAQRPSSLRHLSFLRKIAVCRRSREDRAERILFRANLGPLSITSIGGKTFLLFPRWYPSPVKDVPFPCPLASNAEVGCSGPDAGHLFHPSLSQLRTARCPPSPFRGPVHLPFFKG